MINVQRVADVKVIAVDPELHLSSIADDTPGARKSRVSERRRGRMGRPPEEQ
jgi:hypothetical protein